MSKSPVKAMLSIGDSDNVQVWLASLDSGGDYVALSFHGDAVRFLSVEQAREVAAYLNEAADKLADGTITVSVKPPRHSSR